jgi:hypothetical protein
MDRVVGDAHTYSQKRMTYRSKIGWAGCAECLRSRAWKMLFQGTETVTTFRTMFHRCKSPA